MPTSSGWGVRLMRFSRLMLANVPLLALGGCVTGQGLSLQAIDAKAVEEAQTEIKRQIGVYFVVAKNAHDAEIHALTRPEYWCGDGSLDYEVVSVKVDLLTTQSDMNSAKVGLKIPVFAGAGSVSPSGSASRTTTNTQELTYVEYMLPENYQPAELLALKPDVTKLPPIARIMMDTRNALIHAASRSHSDPQPCFTNFNPVTPLDASTTITIGVKFETDGVGGVQIDLGLVSAGVSNERKGASGNTITVTFRQRGLSKEMVIQPCDKPHPNWACPVPKIDAAKPDGKSTDVHVPLAGGQPPRDTNGEMSDHLPRGSVDPRLFGDDPPAHHLRHRLKHSRNVIRKHTASAVPAPATLPVNCPVNRQTGVMTDCTKAVTR